MCGINNIIMHDYKIRVNDSIHCNNKCGNNNNGNDGNMWQTMTVTVTVCDAWILLKSLR